MQSAGATIAMVVKGWPRLSESFIAQEVLALEQRGLNIALFSLRHPTDKVTSAFQKKIKATVTYLPEYLHQEPLRVLKGWWSARRKPGYRTAIRSFVRDLRRDFTRNRVRRFGQALVLAHELPDDCSHLHAHFLHTPCSVARYAAIVCARPFSFSAHAKDIWTTPKWEKSDKISDAAFGVTCTKLGLEDLWSCVGPGDQQKLHLVYHGIDTARFPIQAPKASSEPSALKILSVGRLVEKKGFDVLLRALAQLPPSLDWQWTHFGAGPEAPRLKKIAQSHQIDRRISWRGAVAQEDLLDAYGSHDLFVLPSRQAENKDQDGLPNVLMEAQSQALACIASNIAGIPELIFSQKTGVLVPPDDTAALSAAIVDLASDPQKRSALGHAAQKRIQSSFQLADHVGTLENLLRRAVA